MLQSKSADGGMLESRAPNGPGDGLFGLLGKTPFRKQVGWHVKQGTPHAAVITITPAIAEDLLKRNFGEGWQNRSLSRITIEKYKNAMQCGWRLTGETIIISKSGRLLNGQHRLHACLISGSAFTTFVVFGIDDDAFAFMDRGKIRTAGDIFSIQGIPDANMVAAATLWVWKYHNTKMLSPDGAQTPPPDQLFDYFGSHHPQIPESIKAGRPFGERKIAGPSLMTALHYLCSRKNREASDWFFSSVATGAELRAIDPALKLRNKLIEDRIGGSRIADIYVAAYTVQAWNAMRQNKRIGLFRWRGEGAPDQPFPSII